ncbi:peptidoglycan D,D-transpeptidase FtsI family protein [Tomitella fengzijianii]|uniref:Penicillin-binding protein 2 n=1 Tax=Tomitella fengzijianii TaxID=2597660 RepID=A0A516X5C4_9ACTN|nr:penicillin-binding protein 2 [Tomitella fengzijianii]QDQ97871.1 penicillin-binding protein 2 [Tomitella fengzijianii]
MTLMLVAVVGKLMWVQVVRAPELSAQSASQRTVTTKLPATRGDIVDTNGKPLAYTVDARALTFQPARVRDELTEAHTKDPEAPTVEEYIDDAVAMISAELGDQVDARELRKEMSSGKQFVYLARQVDPRKASKITSEFGKIGSDPDNIREYPGGALAANIIGATRWDGSGLVGLESSMQSMLAGTAGSKTYDRGSGGDVIPGSVRDVHPAQNGSTVELTIDSDLQYFVQDAVQKAKDASGAQNVSALVLDADTAQVLAMSNDNTFDPSIGVGDPANDHAELGNISVTTPFEPGSVNKIITASAAIEYGLTTPEEVLQVPGSITMDGVTVADAWPHGVAPYTTTGIFGKSSNVGTLMLAQRVGQDRFAEMVKKFGLGQRTGVGLPGESAGSVPPEDQWSAGTFANLPIGQGLSMTLLQMADMYQTIANDGLRVPPRIVEKVVGPDGQVTTPEAPDPVRVVSPETASTVRDMFRAVVQDDGGNQRGTGVPAAVEGYQVSGKTGTAQQIDPDCGCYSNSEYWITFAGMAPTQDPRFVVAVMMDRPRRSADGSGGMSAAPLFHDIASWLLQREQVPLSPPAPKLILQAG